MPIDNPPPSDPSRLVDPDDDSVTAGDEGQHPIRKGLVPGTLEGLLPGQVVDPETGNVVASRPVVEEQAPPTQVIDGTEATDDDGDPVDDGTFDPGDPDNDPDEPVAEKLDTAYNEDGAVIAADASIGDESAEAVHDDKEG